MIVFGSMAHYLMNYAGRFCPAGAGSIVRATDSMWAYLWEISVFKINPNKLAIFGAVSVFISIVVIGLSKDLSGKDGKQEGFRVLQEDDDERTDSPEADVHKIQLAKSTDAMKVTSTEF